MCKPNKRFMLSAVSLIVMTALTNTGQAIAQQSEDDAIEEVVTTGTRLKGTATAVIEERKNQAFVADILGAEQISRTGDSDAASALRRVTGLTLVDGKFIYVRGLGERYSSTALNSASVPSPDPTRNVIPLDLFPADIIESLSVQKSYSPSMPASFGGGNVDIRLKSIPAQLVFNASVGTGYNTENGSNGLDYNGGGDDWRGQDDGSRAAPDAIAQRWASKNFLDNLEQDVAVGLLSQVKRDYDPFEESIGPDGSFNLTLGNSFDLDDDRKWRVGFLATAGYKASTEVSQQYELQQADRVGDDIINVRFFDDISATERTVQWSHLFNLGIDYNRNHQIDYSLIVLNDTRDEIRTQFGNTENLSQAEGIRIRDIVTEYEERRLFTNQVRGKHTFPELNFLGFDWRVSVGRSLRNAPGNMEARFIIEDANQDDIFDEVNEISLINAPTAGRYSFQTLNDRLENSGYNFTYPVSSENWEMEFKYGADFVTKSRTAENRRFDINTRAIADSSLLIGNSFGDILSNDVLNSAAFNSAPIIRDTTIAGDDYVAGQKIDAYYIEGDFFYKNKWRFSGGFRWEDFRQVVAPLDPRTNQFDLADDADRSELAFQEDDFYPAFAVTYIKDDSMQFRASIGQTVVRPDLREVSSATFIDPLTEFPIAGTPGVRTTSIINYDLRWEWYRELGNNLSIGLFYKDMEDPIESVQSPAQDGPPLIRIANAESGVVYGVELEFLQDLSFVGDGIWENLFLSGNLTVSDSEIELDRQSIVDQTGVSAAITNIKRRLTGHSQFVANLQMGYDSVNGEHSASLVYNVFGDRILIPGIDGFDDSFETPFHSLDTVYKYYPNFNTTITFKVQNLLDQDKELEFEGVLLRSETRGRGLSLSYKYDFY
ncbi:TonB-dependent receptor domain-containing protein [Glaciecola petra]|uniref:TonB-dependent receptor plug domain-containing protein n=1 Tax=Glaciecola petra TaxID=3075602 RepID=A0ABU2ZLB5_9ALTE|nr:TonB-dependent receptor [Aestuariibacter sp. P117]MDT0593416.1 TonB-dependent receptor plug domain-containing protein [Aestuariibacter sp. P117]